MSPSPFAGARPRGWEPHGQALILDINQLQWAPLPSAKPVIVWHTFNLFDHVPEGDANFTSAPSSDGGGIWRICLHWWIPVYQTSAAHSLSQLKASGRRLLYWIVGVWADCGEWKRCLWKCMNKNFEFFGFCNGLFVWHSVISPDLKAQCMTFTLHDIHLLPTKGIKYKCICIIDAYI